MASWTKQIFIFLALNALVVLTTSFFLMIFGVATYINRDGMDYLNLMGFCLIWGMTGSLTSLSLSRMMAKWMMGVKLIDPDTRSADLQQFLSTVYRLARTAGLSVMPEVGIYQSPDLNAFATGPTRSRSLVAVSSGLLSKMTQEEIEGVKCFFFFFLKKKKKHIGHEIYHRS